MSQLKLFLHSFYTIDSDFHHEYLFLCFIIININFIYWKYEYICNFCWYSHDIFPDSIYIFVQYQYFGTHLSVNPICVGSMIGTVFFPLPTSCVPLQVWLPITSILWQIRIIRFSMINTSRCIILFRILSLIPKYFEWFVCKSIWLWCWGNLTRSLLILIPIISKCSTFFSS